jgi:hypothetical protein
MKLPPHFDLGGSRISMAAASVKISMSHFRQQPGAPVSTAAFQGLQFSMLRIWIWQCIRYLIISAHLL